MPPFAYAMRPAQQHEGAIDRRWGAVGIFSILQQRIPSSTISTSFDQRVTF